MKELATIIGQRIRNHRTHLGYSQEKLAEIAACHPTYIGQVERGEKNVTIESIEKITTALGIPLSQLFEKIGDESNTKSDYPLMCYEFVSSKEIKEQELIYKILMQIDHYKNL